MSARCCFTSAASGSPRRIRQRHMRSAHEPRAAPGTSAMKLTTDVMIVGGGPVGLMLAAELQRRRVDHVLIEQQPKPTYFVKALGITPRTLEIWAHVGIAQAAIDAGLF